jgi:hypothetical protein
VEDKHEEDYWFGETIRGRDLGHIDPFLPILDAMADKLPPQTITIVGYDPTPQSFTFVNPNEDSKSD